ncbi:MAG TPA: aldose 1-epimerase family protein [Streptosporangiaceae bacterium]|nr:aldose 1-epimerase family protein [Streptosporangiaceae bacterium]
MPESTLPLTGAQYDIAAGDYQATVTELGAGLRSLRVSSQPVIRQYDADDVPPAGAGQLLAPWPNRIDHGQYTFGGRSYQLDLSEPARGNAIHGLTRFASWRLVERKADHVELGLQLLGRPGYPFCLELSARYQLTEETGLEVTVTARNAGSRPAPFGTGSHPYLLAGTGTVDSWQLQLPAARWQPTDDRGIPAGRLQEVAGSEYDFRERRPIGSTSLDTAFTGLYTGGDGTARVRLTGPDAEVALWAGPGYRWLQVFTGDPLSADARRRALAIEPMTCPPNAFVTGIDLLTIEPGASATQQWGIQAKKIR